MNSPYYASSTSASNGGLTLRPNKFFAKNKMFSLKLILIFIMSGLFCSVLVPAYAEPVTSFITDTPHSVTNSTKPTIVGSAKPGTIIAIFIDDKLLGKVMCNIFGNWLYTPTIALTQNSHKLSAYRVNTAGIDYTTAPEVVNITVDSVPPSVEVLPEDGARSVPTSSKITMLFSESVLHADEGRNFSFRSNGISVKGINSYDNNSRLLTFTPSEPLHEGVTYTAYLGNGITDAYGNPIHAKSWSFTVGDFTPPVITSLQPQANVYVKGTVNLNAYVKDNTGVKSVSFVYSADFGSTWKTIANINKSSSGTIKNGLWSFDWNTKSLGIEGKVIIRASASDSVNTVENENKINIDNSIPKILTAGISKINYSPDSNNSHKMQSISYKVNEDAYVTVQILSPKSALVATLATNQSVTADEPVSLAWNGHMENDSDAAFIDDGNYTALIQVVDQAGNAGIPASLDFKYDRVKPFATAYQPTNSNVSVGSWPKVIFNEDMDPNTINSNSFSLRNLISGNVFPCSIYYDAQSKTAYMQSNVFMESNTLYEVTVANGIENGVEDLAGNSLKSELKWKFTTEQNNNSPVIFNYNPGEYKGDARIQIHVKDDTKVNAVIIDYSKDDKKWNNLPGEVNLVQGDSQDGWWENKWDTTGKEGPYFMRITARDDLGNSTIYKYSVNVLKTDKAVINETGIQQKINLMNNEVAINIPAKTFNNVNAIEATEVSLQNLPDMPITKVFVGGAYNFAALDPSGNIVEKFANPVNVTMNYDLTGKEFLEESSLHIYYYNPTTKEWERLITKLDKKNKTISAQLPHFSLYAVLAEGKHIYLPTQKYKISGGELTTAFVADNITNSPYETYLPNEQEPWNYRIHSNYTKGTDACASCHSTHTAVGGSLLQWYTVYDTCMACHDGTVTTTYDVVEGKIGASGMPAFGGAFGSGNEKSLSRHNVRGGTRIAMAPGGTVAAVTYPELGEEIISWQLDFGCESCHEPHGQGGNARILNPDPNGAARRNWIGGDFISDDRVGQTRDVTDWTEVSNDTVDNIRTIKYAVYPKRNSPLGMIRDTQQKPLTWLTGYLYTDPSTNYTKIKDKDYPNGIPPNKYKIDNSNGYTYIVFTDTGKSGPDDYLPKEPKEYMKMNFVAALSVSMETTNYLQKNEKVQLGTGMNNFCGSCHTNFNTATTDNFVYGSDVNKEDFTYHRASTMTTQHQVGMSWSGDETISTTVGSVTYTVYKMRFEKDPWGVNDKQIVTCLTCHFAHGSSEDYWSRLYGEHSVLGSIYKDADLIESSGVSYLKRLPNDDLCNECHPKTETYQPKHVIPDNYTQDNATYVGSSKDTCGNESCHPKQYTGWEKTKHEVAGVTCEACHGPASVHTQVYSELNITVPYNL